MESTTQTNYKAKIGRKWISLFKNVLIIGGAGISIVEGESYYINSNDFGNAYPGLLPFGYHTAYEAMGLIGDPNVPIGYKWGYLVEHINNMRFKNAPHKRYTQLLSLIKDKNYFAYTSNVDGCFVRAGFNSEHIYTPQGDLSNLQCSTPCTRKPFLSSPIITPLLQHIKNTCLPENYIPQCPDCNKPYRLNVRGGSWFIHDHYNPAQKRFIDWIDNIKKNLPSSTPTSLHENSLLIIEIGAGWNTPMVTRFCAESIIRDLPGSAIIRINPTDSECPEDILNALEIDSSADEFFKQINELEQNDGTIQEVEREKLYQQLIQQRKELKKRRTHNLYWKDILESLAN